jgi:hypothetical protein
MFFNWLNKFFKWKGEDRKVDDINDPFFDAIMNKVRLTTYVQRLVQEVAKELAGKIMEPYGVRLLLRSSEDPSGAETSSLVTVLVQVMEGSSKVYSLERILDISHKEGVEEDRRLMEQHKDIVQEITKFVDSAIDGSIAPDYEDDGDEDIRLSF